VRKKYVKQFPICLIPSRVNDSSLWKDLLKIRHIYLMGREYKVNNRKSVNFWMDVAGRQTTVCNISTAI
jgi:hypothetical protein